MAADLYPASATALALLVYFWTFVMCGRARGRHGIMAPATSGHPEFERWFRVQQNTLEQLVLFLPSLWIFAWSVSPLWAGVLGAVWAVGRILYGIAYARDPKSRAPGFGISMLAMLVLLFGGIAGLVRIAVLAG